MNKTGFGFLRLPEIEKDGAKEIDYPLVDRMVDDYMSRGGRYFDTAYTYLDGRSEAAVKRCLVERHDRGSFILADKLPGWKVKKPEDNRIYFNEQLERCGVDWFDVYLIHWLNAANFEVAERMDQFAFLSQLKKEGLAKKVGFSYHDGPELLERILSAHPDIDIVQLQINYLDWESPASAPASAMRWPPATASRSSSWSLSRAARWLPCPRRPKSCLKTHVPNGRSRHGPSASPPAPKMWPSF